MKKINNRILVSILIFFIFIVDITIPANTGLGVLYTIPMTIAFNQNKKGIFFFSIICGILILIDDIIHFNPKIEYAIFIENILAFVAIGLSSLATIKYKMLKEQSENRREEKIKAIKQMLFMTSHRLRQPICNIQGLGMLLDNNELSTQELREISSYLKDSIAKLDIYSKELTDFLSNIKEEEEM